MTDTADQSIVRPIGPRAEGDCALIDDPDGPCFIRPAWRVVVLEDTSNREDRRSRIGRTFREPPERVRVVRLACVVHLAHVITLTDEAYGGNVMVEAHHG